MAQKLGKRIDKILMRTVHKSNKSSGKITLPKRLIGKRVSVIIHG